MSEYEGEIVERAPVRAPYNPFAVQAAEGTNTGAVAVESQRATAEVQGRMVVAKRFPRDAAAAYARVMQSCQRIGLAECAIYSFTKGQKVEGPSIRLAEEMARQFGNIEYGLNELSRFQGGSEMEAFAWDLETNTRSSQRFTVKHIRDKSDGGKTLTTERDIYEITANQGSRRMRARILAILPPELVDDAVAACKETIKRGGGQPLEDRIRAMTVAFARVGVTAKMLTDRLTHSLDEVTPDELVELRGVLQAIKDGARAGEFFGAKPGAPAPAPDNADAFETAGAGVTVVPSVAEVTKGDSIPALDPEPDTKDAAAPADDAAAWTEAHIARMNTAATDVDLLAIQAEPKVKAALAKLGKTRPDLTERIAAAYGDCYAALTAPAADAGESA